MILAALGLIPPPVHSQYQTFPPVMCCRDESCEDISVFPLFAGVAGHCSLILTTLLCNQRQGWPGFSF